ncbi:trpC [Acrasis kona]|uniref:TrpC n=1 Tax=Acrasis kona TaxID=1008807 RepID=A0AAW2Z6M2_9EUKA
MVTYIGAGLPQTCSILPTVQLQQNMFSVESIDLLTSSSNKIIIFADLICKDNFVSNSIVNELGHQVDQDSDIMYLAPIIPLNFFVSFRALSLWKSISLTDNINEYLVKSDVASSRYRLIEQNNKHSILFDFTPVLKNDQIEEGYVSEEEDVYGSSDIIMSAPSLCQTEMRISTLDVFDFSFILDKVTEIHDNISPSEENKLMYSYLTDSTVSVVLGGDFWMTKQHPYTSVVTRSTCCFHGGGHLLVKHLSALSSLEHLLSSNDMLLSMIDGKKVFIVGGALGWSFIDYNEKWHFNQIDNKVLWPMHSSCGQRKTFINVSGATRCINTCFVVASGTESRISTELYHHLLLNNTSLLKSKNKIVLDVHYAGISFPSISFSISDQFSIPVLSSVDFWKLARTAAIVSYDAMLNSLIQVDKFITLEQLRRKHIVPCRVTINDILFQWPVLYMEENSSPTALRIGSFLSSLFPTNGHKSIVVQSSPQADLAFRYCFNQSAVDCSPYPSLLQLV